VIANLLVKYNQPRSENETDTSQPENSDVDIDKSPSEVPKRK
jgi:hypothetical protein